MKLNYIKDNWNLNTIGLILIVIGWVFDFLLATHLVPYTPNFFIESLGIFFIGYHQGKNFNWVYVRNLIIINFVWFMTGLVFLNYYILGRDLGWSYLGSLIIITIYIIIIFVSYVLGARRFKNHEKNKPVIGVI